MPTSFLKRPLLTLLQIVVLGYSAAMIYLVSAFFLSDYRASDGYSLPSGEILGGDFICFYAAGKMLREAPKSLYDFPRQLRYQRELLGEKGDGFKKILPFVYPPFVALGFSALSDFTFLQAYLLWVFLSVVLFSLAVLLLLKELKSPLKEQVLLFVCAFGFPPFVMESLAGGQTSVLGVVVYSLVFTLLHRKKDFWAGVALGFGAYKPPLFLFLSLSLLFAGRWRVIAGACFGAIVLMTTAGLLVGFDGLMSYLKIMTSYTYGEQVSTEFAFPLNSKMAGLYEFFLFYSRGARTIPLLLFVGIYGAVLVACGKLFPLKSEGSEDTLQCSFAIIAVLSLFLSPYILVYDLALLVVPFILIAVPLLRHPLEMSGLLVIIGMFVFYAEWLLRGLRDGSGAFLFLPLLVGLLLQRRTREKEWGNCR